MSFDKCLLTLHAQEKLPVSDIRDTAKQYQAEGVEYAAAMRRATQDHLDMARTQEAKIIDTVHRAYVEQGGKLPESAQQVAEPAAGDEAMHSRTADDLGIKSDLMDHMDAIADERGMMKASDLADWVRKQDAPAAAPLANWLDVMGDATVAQSSVMKYLEHSGNEVFSRFDPKRRQMMAAAAALALHPRDAGSGVKLGEAKPIDAAVLGDRVGAKVERLLRASGASGDVNQSGMDALRGALQEIAIRGPHDLRALADQVEKLLPPDGKMHLTIDDSANVNMNGSVKMSPDVHMTLYTAEGRTGLTYETILHEAMHVAVAARYRTLAAEARASGNDDGPRPAAAHALDQFHQVWGEFREMAAGEQFVNADLHMAVTEAMRSPDEFFVRALTDPKLQAYMAGRRYNGTTLWHRFKDWVKTNVFGMEKGGTAPSWLDAALTASNELAGAMHGDAADFASVHESAPAIMESRAAPGRDEDADRTALSKIIKVPKDAMKSVLFETRMLVVPMAAGSDKAMALAKDFANQNRRAGAQWEAFDKVLRANYDEDQLRRMWDAADQENDLRREGRTSTKLGLASLDEGERKTVELLHTYGQQLWARAQGAGLVEGEGVHFWTPRVAARIAENGDVEAIRQPAGEFSKDAKNLRTSASSTKQRNHETTADSEDALRAKLGEDAAYLKNIRVMPMAMAQLERAIAGRTLVNQIKAHGKVAGEDLVNEHGGPDFVTFDHPALKQWRPMMDWHPADKADLAARGYDVRPDGVYRAGDRMASYRVRDGEAQQLKPVLDSDGKPLMTSHPLFIRKDFAGPLKAVFTKDQGAIYRGLMGLKGGVTSMIMISPLTHNLVIWGKAMPTMISTMGWKSNLKNAGTLGIHGYFVGNRARADHALMNELIDAGLVPVSGRGMSQDVESIGNGIKPGRSLTAKAVGAVFDRVSPKAGDMARRGVDKAGQFWHEKLLWDRVADLQAGMAVMMRASLMDKGIDQYTANRLATHFANRYAGMIPGEALSQGANMLLNLTLFSKSFTMTNLGAYKDLIAGLPKDAQAQIKTRVIEMQRALGRDEDSANQAAGKVLGQAQRIARTKGAAVLALDVAAMATLGSIAQALIQGQSWQQFSDDFKDRLARLGVKLKDDPLHIIGHPLDALSSLSQTSDNPHGREDRVRIGEDAKGNSYYGRLPVGKVGEELKTYGDLTTGMHMLRNKMSTFVRPVADLMIGEDVTGKRIILPHENIVKQAAAVGAYWVKSQMPLDDLAALKHVVTGDAQAGDKVHMMGGDWSMDGAKLLGTGTGLTVNKLTGGDVVAEMRYHDREAGAQLRDVLPDVREAIVRGDTDRARELLTGIGMTPQQAIRRIDQMVNPGHITPGQMRKFNRTATDDERERLDRMRAR